MEGVLGGVVVVEGGGGVSIAPLTASVLTSEDSDVPLTNKKSSLDFTPLPRIKSSSPTKVATNSLFLLGINKLNFTLFLEFF